MTVTGWKLDICDRVKLLQRFPPAWPDKLADHITLDAHADERDKLPGSVRAEIVGSIDDGDGLQALVVAIDGRTGRPDGSTYHITWSIDRKRGRKPVDSNRVLAEREWERFEDPIPIHIMPARWG